MQKAEPKHGLTQRLSAIKQRGGTAAASPQGGRIAQLTDMILSSPHQAAQRKKFDSLFGTVQRTGYGFPVNNERGLEHEAEVMGARAAGIKAHANPNGTGAQPRPQDNQAAQLLSEEAVIKLFETNDTFLRAYNDDKWEPSNKVRQKIATMTSEWESRGKNDTHRDWRKKYVERAVSEILGTLEEEVQSQLLNNAGYWETELEKAFKDAETLFRPDSEKIKKQHAILSNPESDESKSFKKRIMVEVTMGQGVDGDLRKFNFFSSKFSSCSAVAMYNSSTHIGGLFHYAAKNTYQHQELKRMHDKIAPTLILMAVNTKEDFAAVRELLGNGVAKIAGGSDSHSLFLNPDGQAELVKGKLDHSASLNLTGMESMPEEIGKATSLTMYYEPKAYAEIFESMPLF